jgi:2-methylisocitrate lyase-like PEP mutase family enzyme
VQSDWGEVGVARVSVGPWIAQAALAATQRAAVELIEHGTYASLESRLPFAELNTMFSERPELKNNESLKSEISCPTSLVNSSPNTRGY